MDRPHYGVGPVEAVRRFIAKYAVFSGRASRSEYWWVQLAIAVLGFALGTVGALAIGVTVTVAPDTSAGAVPAVLLAIAVLVVVIGLIVPRLALAARRLHDAGFSALLLLLLLVPYLGEIAVLVLTILPSKAEGARFDEVRA